MRLPTERDFHWPLEPSDDALDQIIAMRNFLGKDLEAAEAQFGENMLRYGEDLMFMGSPAFVYYVEAAIAYILSENAKSSAPDLHVFLGVVAFRLEHDGNEIAAAIPAIESAYQRLVSSVTDYGDESEIAESRKRLARVRSVLDQIHP